MGIKGNGVAVPLRSDGVLDECCSLENGRVAFALLYCALRPATLFPVCTNLLCSSCTSDARGACVIGGAAACWRRCFLSALRCSPAETLYSVRVHVSRCVRSVSVYRA